MPIWRLGFPALVAGALLVPACASSSTRGTPAASVAAPASIDSIVADTLRRSLADAAVVPDRNQLPSAGPIAVRQEVLTPGEGYLLGAAALPGTREPAFELHTQTELQSLADQQARPVYFVVFDGAVMSDDEVTLRVGVDFVVPRGQVAAPNACCWCRAELTYRKTGDGWHMVSRGPCVEPKLRTPVKKPATPSTGPRRPAKRAR